MTLCEPSMTSKTSMIHSQIHVLATCHGRNDGGASSHVHYNRLTGQTRRGCPQKHFFDFHLEECKYRNRDPSESGTKAPAVAWVPFARVPIEPDSASISHRQNRQNLQRQREWRIYTDSWFQHLLCIECILGGNG